MSRLLIVYGTTDGHTRKIAAAMADTLRADGHAVALFDAAAIDPAVSPAWFDGVLVAGSVHMHAYSRALARWVRAHAPALDARPSAFVSVCLGVLQHDPAVDRDLQKIIGEFLRATRWSARLTKIVAGAIPYTRYGWLKKRLMRRMAARAGGGTDVTRDYEYTDWADVAAFARDFGRRLASGGLAADAELVRYAALRA